MFSNTTSSSFSSSHLPLLSSDITLESDFLHDDTIDIDLHSDFTEAEKTLRIEKAQNTADRFSELFIGLLNDPEAIIYIQPMIEHFISTCRSTKRNLDMFNHMKRHLRKRKEPKNYDLKLKCLSKIYKEAYSKMWKQTTNNSSIQASPKNINNNNLNIVNSPEL